MSGLTPCRSVARATLGALNEGGAVLRCGLLADHAGEHRFEMSWRDAPTGDVAADVEEFLRFKQTTEDALRRRIASVEVMAERASRKGYDLDPDEVLDAIAAAQPEQTEPTSGGGLA